MVVFWDNGVFRANLKENDVMEIFLAETMQKISGTLIDLQNR